MRSDEASCDVGHGLTGDVEMGIEICGRRRGAETCHADEGIVRSQNFAPTLTHGRFDTHARRGAEYGAAIGILLLREELKARR